jgi:uncharacterized protein (UPF0335 family)
MDGCNGINAGQLKAIVERIESVEANISQEQEARREIYTEAKSMGFDPKIIRKVVALRKKPKAARDEEAELLELYMSAVQLSLDI